MGSRRQLPQVEGLKPLFTALLSPSLSAFILTS
jgi:hypothetical protein